MLASQFRRLVSKPLFAIAAATVATDARPESRLSVEEEELLEDLEVLEQLDANGAAIPERICPCLKGEIDACGDKFLKSFGCALLYRRDFSKSTAECMRAHQLYIECKEAYDAAHKDDKKPEKTEA